MLYLIGPVKSLFGRIDCQKTFGSLLWQPVEQENENEPD
jgi:hypothetical protein